MLTQRSVSYVTEMWKPSLKNMVSANSARRIRIKYFWLLRSRSPTAVLRSPWNILRKACKFWIIFRYHLLPNLFQNWTEDPEVLDLPPNFETDSGPELCLLKIIESRGMTGWWSIAAQHFTILWYRCNCFC